MWSPSTNECMLGGRSRNSTQLLLIGAEHSKHRLLSEPNRCRCNHASGQHTTLLGKKSTGRFRTMAAKEYLGGMCRLLARGVEAYLERTLAPGGERAMAPAQLHNFTGQATRDADAEIGADYAR